MKTKLLAAMGLLGSVTFSLAQTPAPNPTSGLDVAPLPAPSPSAQSRLGNLLSLDLEALTKMEVTSVSKRLEPLFEAPSAISVITNEDIHRSGMRTYPELLRMVPGIEVAQINSNRWSVASRGFGGRFSDKLLVLMDGRTIYSPFFSGVIWDQQDYLLEDIDRIEVIRGPGATLWGANAVNGVINIQSKDSDQTQGSYLEGGYGTQTGFEGVRYGGRVNEQLTYRVYQKYTHDNPFNPTRGDSFDQRDFQQSGFRTDWKPSTTDNFTFQGDLYTEEMGNRSRVGSTLATASPPRISTPLTGAFAGLNSEQLDVNDTIKASGGNVLGRWKHVIEEGNDLTLQAYYDRTYRNELFYTETRNTLDLDFKHNIVPLEGHQVVWGFGSRGTFDYLENGDAPGGIALSTFNQSRRSNLLVSGFIQDTITLVPEKVFVTPGTKLERNDYSGLEVEPGLKLTYLPIKDHTLWASMARSVRTPNRGENDANILINNASAGGVVTLAQSRVALVPNSELASQEVFSFELGHRWQATQKLRLQTTGFYNMYRSVSGFNTFTPNPATNLATVQPANSLNGASYGVEAEADYQPFELWRLSGNYSWWHAQMRGDDPTSIQNIENSTPQQQVKLKSSLDLPQNISFDQMLFWVDKIQGSDTSVLSSPPTFVNVPSYFRLDLRMAWHPSPNWELSVTGQNLLDPLHVEAITTTFAEPPTQIPRSVYGMVTVKF